MTPENFPSFVEAGESNETDLTDATFYMELCGEDSHMSGKIINVETHTDPEDGEVSFRCHVIIDEVELRGVGSRHGEGQLGEALRHTTGLLQAVAITEGGDIQLYRCKDGECRARYLPLAKVGEQLFAASEFGLQSEPRES